MAIKEKTKELLVKQLKTSEKKMQELTDSIKRPNLRIVGIEEVEEVQAKGIHNMFNKIITQNFPNLEKSMPIQVQEASRTPNRPEQKRTTPRHIIIKTSKETQERILKAIREQKQITYKGKPIKITADFSTETLKARRAWGEVFGALNGNNFNPRILYPATLSFKIDEAIKDFHYKQKLKQSHHYKRFFKGFCTQKVKPNITMKGQTAPNHRKRKSKKVENNLNLGTHNQTFKQLRQLNNRNHKIPISTNT
jgi:hypothetical protein